MKAYQLCPGVRLLLLLTSLAACSPLTPSPAPGHSAAEPASSSAPFFTSETGEAKIYRSLSREQDGRLLACGQDHSCDRAHFTRGLIALYENQESAAKHFQDVITLSPKSHLAALSRSWLKLLAHPFDERQDTVFARTTQWLIQDLFAREQSIKQELSGRDKKLEELSTQLEALKQIDLEIKEKSYHMRPRPKGIRGTEKPN